MARDSDAKGRFGLRRAGRALWSRTRMRLHKEGSSAPTGPPVVTFEGHEPLSVSAGDTLLDAAATAGVGLAHYCGGTCSCGTCRVEIVAGAEHLEPAAGREEMVLGHRHIQAGDRLACQARVRGPVVVRVPKYF
jgi:ferredoxin, 2Fe-2S